jgi:hypothetical protein
MQQLRQSEIDQVAGGLAVNKLAGYGMAAIGCSTAAEYRSL